MSRTAYQRYALARNVLRELLDADAELRANGAESPAHLPDTLKSLWDDLQMDAVDANHEAVAND